MKDFQLITNEKEINFKFPTSLNEINENYLKFVTNNINVADNYTLIGIVYHESLGAIIIGRKQAKKTISAGVIPIFIKSGKTDNNFINSMKIKNKIIISSTQLSLGHHVVAPKNTLSIDYFVKILDKDTTVAQRYSNNYGKDECYFIEFKLVPNCDIVGFYDSNKQDNIINPYVEVKDLEETKL